MKKIDISECHELLLDIAKELDRICTKHNIPYYMLGGTMLGAIRHKGFIPWDDDMDFGVPRQYYRKLIEILEKELPTNYMCCTFENNIAINSPFCKICNTDTLINDPRVSLPIEKQLGLNIDIFPLDYCEKNDSTIRKIYRLRYINQVAYISSTKASLSKKIIKRIIKALFPVKQITILRKAESLAESLPKGDYMANIFGRWKSKEIVPAEWYGQGVRYEFEDAMLCGFQNYDSYLTQMYGDYMQLPPEEKREAHIDNVFARK